MTSNARGFRSKKNSCLIGSQLSSASCMNRKEDECNLSQIHKTPAEVWIGLLCSGPFTLSLP